MEIAFLKTKFLSQVSLCVTISPIIESLSRRPTNQRTVTPKKFLHCYGSSRMYNRFPNLGIWQRGWDPPGIWLWRPVAFDYSISTWMGKHFGGTQTKLCTPGAERREHWPRKRLSQTCLWVSRSLWQRCGSRHWIQQCWHNSFWRRSPLPLP